MPLLIGSATLAATLLSMAFGQIDAGHEAFGVLLAAFLLGERLSPAALAGAAIVLLATILIVRYDVSY